MDETGTRRGLMAAIKDERNSHLVMLALPLFFYLLTTIVLFIAWGTHNARLQMNIGSVGNSVLLVLCIIHCWIYKGRRQTIAFFGIAWVLSWFCEFIGDNYAWFFGHYKYTDALGPRIGGVPFVIVITWSLVIYSSFMIINWLIDLKGERRGRTWFGKLSWATLIAAATATMVCAWDLMVDPFAISKAWSEVGLKGFWYWERGGPYLKELAPWHGKPGVPIGNFVGWWLAPFAIVLIFYLLFQRPDRQSGKLLDFFPVLAYGYLFYSIFWALMVMNWFDDGINQVAMIGIFTMMPVVGICVIKFLKEFVMPVSLG